MSAPATANLFAALDTKKKKTSTVRLRFLPTPTRPLAAGGARARRSRAGPALSRTVPARASKNTKVAAPQSHPESPPSPSLARSPQEDKKDKKKDKKEKEARENLLDEKLWELPRPDATSLVGGLTRIATTTAPPADSAAPGLGRQG